MTDPNSRATDPGFRLWQIADPKWVHCPRCAGPARLAGSRLTCTRCGHAEGAPILARRRLRQVATVRASLACGNRACGAPLPDRGVPVRGGAHGMLMARIACPTCGQVGRYPALPAAPGAVRAAPALLRAVRRGRGGAPYLRRRIGRHDLFVYNRQHLDALEAWLGAEHRERGPIGGLTMMARLPRWMKAARARAEVVKALRALREQAEREGLW